MVTISDKAALALKDCIASRGKNKGQLMAKCPPSNTLAAAAWQGAMIVCNPYKVSIAALMFMTDEQREVYREVERVLGQLPLKAAIGLDRDREALEGLGAW